MAAAASSPLTTHQPARRQIASGSRPDRASSQIGHTISGVLPEPRLGCRNPTRADAGPSYAEVVTDVHRIGLRIDAGDSPDWPRVTVLIDGEDIIGHATGFKGFDPDDLLAEDGPLLPQEPPRRVAIYRCSCGEAGCGVAACIVSEVDGFVRWQDFRDFIGVYCKPMVDEDPPGGSRHGLPDLAFDGGQYRAEVARATADRGWETTRRRMARLLRARLLSGQDALAERGYRAGWVTPVRDPGDGFEVELQVPDGQVVVRVDADGELAEGEAVDQLVSALRDQPEQRWHVRHRNHRRTDDR